MIYVKKKHFYTNYMITHLLHFNFFESEDEEGL